MFEVMGYERPCYFREPSEVLDDAEEIPTDAEIPSAPPKTFCLPPWFEATEREYTACRETAGLLDYSSFRWVFFL